MFVIVTRIIGCERPSGSHLNMAVCWLHPVGSPCWEMPSEVWDRPILEQGSAEGPLLYTGHFWLPSMFISCSRETRTTRTGASDKRYLSSASSEGQKSEVKVWAGSCSL